jgi:acyl-CoA reductase-like NAD-dependent aldehyde dehydrogenase
MDVVVADERDMPVKFEVEYTQVFIDNQFMDAESGETFATLNPATEEEIAQIARGSKADVDKAVKAAQRAFEIGSEWRTMDASLRGELL